MKQKAIDIEYGVYSILYKNNGKLLYIGSTDNFARRKKEHIKKLKDGKHNKQLQKYCDENMKDIDTELEFQIIHKTLDNSKIRLFFAEMVCIFLYKPSCNVAVIQFGLKYFRFAEPSVDFDKGILNYI